MTNPTSIEGMEHFGAATRAWFDRAFVEPTTVQRQGWSRIAAGEHCLLIAPTGSGKTLAAFLSCLDRLANLPDEAEPGVRVLYVSPLKALVYDIERNLRAPLIGIERLAEQLELRSHRTPRVAIRTGDTSQKERRQQARNPAEILVTTPESLYLLLGSAAGENLRTVDTVIIDEVHALAPTKRGAHLALSLERLAAMTDQEPQRIGLSATVRPPTEVAHYLGGDRPVSIVDTSMTPRIDLRIVVPVADMDNPGEPVPPTRSAIDDNGGGSLLKELAREPATEAARQKGMWPAIQPKLLELIKAHQSTIVFVNSRGLCERLCQQINELAAFEDLGELARAHHGSLAHEQRREIEEQLKAGAIKAIIATSSLELGIDMGAVDLVVLVESPGSVARGLQRVGRAGHQVDAVSTGRFYPKHRGDLLETTVVAKRMTEGRIEPLRLPRNPLDVLAQQIVATVAVEACSIEDIAALCKRTASFADLSPELLESVLDMLAGRYPSTDFADLRPRIIWDRETDRLTARRGAKSLSLVSGGTIPDRGQYRVTLGPDGARLGELDEEMVHETRAGQVINLGASSWRVERITRDHVEVSPAPGEVGKLPFWHGDGQGRPIELGRALGKFLRHISSRDRDDAKSWLIEEYNLDRLAAKNLLDYIDEQREVTGTLPTDRAITIERFRDELGDDRVCILSPFGARVHAPWALALEARLSTTAGFEIQTLWSNDGIVLRFVGEGDLPAREVLVPEPEEIEDLVIEQLGSSSLFAAQFRENAARSLLLPRQRPGKRMPLWAQRLKAQQLLGVARGYSSFPIVLETYRTCLQDIFDLPALQELLVQIQRRQVRVDEVETTGASPFSRSLVFSYIAAYMYAYAYDGDLPIAERRAHALTLDRNMLRELLGQEGLRELLDATIIAQLEEELQHLAPAYHARHADGLQDLLRRLGDLTSDELALRCEDAPTTWLDELAQQRRIVEVRISGQQRWITAEETGLYRDALGVVPPAGVPSAFLEPVDRPLESLFRRFAKTHGPFLTEDLATRYALVPAQVESVLNLLESRGELLRGEFLPKGRSKEWCDPDVLKRLRRRTLAKLRGEVAPVERAVLARFLPKWHGIDEGQAGSNRLTQVIEQLEGIPLSFAELERAILPARVSGFQPRMLDELGAMGGLVWVGAGSLGGKDGRVALFNRQRVALLLDEPLPLEDETPLHRRILDHLEQRGASFLTELLALCGEASESELQEALWDLVWAGHVTNDTFHPIRALRAKKKSSASGRRARRGRRSGPASWAVGGRWSLVKHLLMGEISPTEKLHARALALLERYGVVSREVMSLENLSGGFSAIYQVLREMEESGKVRRGYFVDGLTGAQFAYAGAVDQLRACRRTPESPEVRILSATDPANPYGALLPWPQLRTNTDGASPPRRVTGATVVTVDGEPMLYLDRGAKKAVTFASEKDEHSKLLHAAAGLRRLAQTRRGKYIRLEKLDGASARSSELSGIFAQAGFHEDYKGLVLEVR